MIRTVSILCVAILGGALVDGLHAEQPTELRIWPSLVPADCPLERSSAWTAVAFTGRHAEYEDADTWYPTWAADGNLYSPWTDGKIGSVYCYSNENNWYTGQAKIIGDHPLELEVVSLGKHRALAAPYRGRYPCGSLVYNGVWYYGTYCLDRTAKDWETMGPFVGFRTSTDFGKTWADTPHTPGAPLFGESTKGGTKVKIGAPHFVDFGRNMEHSPDGKAYLVAHGAVQPGSRCSWIAGDHAYLIRVSPSLTNINDASQFEFFAGHDPAGQPIWSRDFARIRPLLEWNGRIGCPTVTYNAPLKKYIMCFTDGRDWSGPYHTTILESDTLTGPWRVIAFMENFGDQAYFVNIPSKFIGADGRTMWLCYSHNWYKKDRADPPARRYSLCLQEFRLLSKTP